MIRRILIFFVSSVFFLSIQVGFSQENSEASSSVDSLFEKQEEEKENKKDNGNQAESTVLDRVKEDEPLQIKANVRFIGGYSPGWTKPIGEEGQYEDIPIVDLSSSLSLVYNVSSDLTINQKFVFTYPDYEFTAKELYMDYSIKNLAYLTIGLKKISWGISPNFPYTNIIQRQADSPLSPVKAQNTLIGRLSIPIGIGGIEILAQNKDEYQENPQSPQADRIGFGAKYNFAGERIDINVGSYYQKGLNGRMFVSGITTVTDWMELYAEAVAVNSRTRNDSTEAQQSEDVKEGWVEIAPDIKLYNNNPDYGANIGVVLSFFDNTLDINGEYYYNGEETENTVVGARFPLFWGHNIALNAEYKVPNTALLLQAGYRYNTLFNSSFLAPRISIDLIKHLNAEIVAGMAWGPEEAGYRAENPDEKDRPAFMAFVFTLKGNL